MLCLPPAIRICPGGVYAVKLQLGHRRRPDGQTTLVLLILLEVLVVRRQWQPTPIFLPGNSQGRRNLVGCSTWGGTESDKIDFTFTFHFHALKKMATHPTVLAGRIPGRGESGGLPSIGSHRVGHD